jgi:hypothetical protein
MQVHIKAAASHRAVEFIATDVAAGVPSWFRIEPEARRAIRTSPAHGEFRRNPAASDVGAELIAVARGYLGRELDAEQAEAAFARALDAWSRSLGAAAYGNRGSVPNGANEHGDGDAALVERRDE